MASLQNWIVRLLMVLAVGVLPFAAVDCDLDDGEFEIDIDGWDWHDCHDYWCDDGYYYYEDYCYDTWGCWF